MESEGVASNTSNNSQMAVSYSYGKVESNTATNDLSNYKRPVFVDHIKSKFTWDSGSAESVEEIDKISQKQDFYDGSRNLKWYSSYCSQFNKLPKVCLKDPNCGWCYSSNTCIHGTDEGAVDNCLPRHFVKHEENALKSR